VDHLGAEALENMGGAEDEHVGAAGRRALRGRARIVGAVDVDCDDGSARGAHGLVIVVVVVTAGGGDDLTPAYDPHTGQTRCGRRGLWQVGHAFTVGTAALWVERRLFVRACDCFCLGTAMGALG
jgi:hypothetical protein